MDLSKIVNVFRCCILTWDFLPVVLPAFLIAGAIPVFVPYAKVMRYLGYGASKIKSYAVASISGSLVSMCSCNVVPVADSIYRQGAGIGPTVTFLFAGPAINLVTMVWMFQVVGMKMGLWRLVAVPLCAVASGLIMQAIFRREERQRHQRFTSGEGEAGGRGMAASGPSLGRVLGLFGLLLAVLLFGAPGIPWQVKLPTLALFGAAIALFVPLWFEPEDITEWVRQTGKFLLRVLPILVPAIFLLGLVQNLAFQQMFRYVRPLVGKNTLGSSYLAAAFGSVMYFPMLTEVAFTKALLKDNLIAVGPALALLINGPGVSLPGAILLARIFGWKKTLIYEGLEMFLGGTVGYAFGALYGNYQCPCQRAAPGTIMEDPSSMYAALILFVCLAAAWIRAARRARAPEPAR